MKTPESIGSCAGSFLRRRSFEFLFLLVIAVSCVAVRGQEPQPKPTPFPIPSPFPTAAPTPVPPLISVPLKGEAVTTTQTAANLTDPDPVVYWTVRDAILAALENNVDIAIERKNLRISEFNILAAEGFYDLTLKAAPQYSRSKQPNIGRFSGVSSSVNSTNTTNFNLNAGLDKQIRQGGGSFTSNFDNPRVSSNSGIVSPVYSPELSFSYTQPLLRNRRIDSSRLQIYVAKKDLTLTDSQFRQQVIGVIFQVQQAYWNLADAQHSVTVQSDGVALAQKQVDDDQKQVDVGTLAPLDVITVKATLETRRVALIQAQNAASQALNVLKNLVADGTQGAIWSKQILPTDFFEEPSLNITLDDALVSGYANRPEADQFQIQKEINKLNTDYFRNQTRPQVDFVSTYSITGAGGTPTTSLTCPAGTTLGTNSLCNPGGLPPTVTAANVNSTFVGGYGTALHNLLSNKYNTMTFGVNISFPFRNRTAKANLGKALVTESQTELQERKQLQAIEVDVRNAYQSVMLAKQALDAARLARQYAEIQLDGEQKKFATGLSTTFLVLTRQNDLIQARGTEVNALAAYNNAVSALQQATGTTLSSNNVEIK